MLGMSMALALRGDGLDRALFELLRAGFSGIPEGRVPEGACANAE